MTVASIRLRFVKTARRLLLGFMVFSGLFSLGGGVGLLGLAGVLLTRGLDIEDIPAEALVEGVALVLVGVFTLLTEVGLRRGRRWAWPLAVLLVGVTLAIAVVRLTSDLTLYHGFSAGLNLLLLVTLFLPGVRRDQGKTLEPTAANDA